MVGAILTQTGGGSGDMFQEIRNSLAHRCQEAETRVWFNELSRELMSEGAALSPNWDRVSSRDLLIKSSFLTPTKLTSTRNIYIGLNNKH